MGWELMISSRMSSYTFADLREFANNHPPTRVWIEAAKQELISDLSGQTDELKAFARLLLEDLLVCGAACMERDFLIDSSPRVVVDVATISVLLNSVGQTPDPPDPAFVQYLGGELVGTFTINELDYRRLKTGSIYTISPVEALQTALGIVKSMLGIVTIDKSLKDAVYSLSEARIRHE